MKQDLLTNAEVTKENAQKIVAQLVVENANMQRRIHDLLEENTEWKLENERLSRTTVMYDELVGSKNNIIDKAIEYLNKHCKYLGDNDYLWYLENWEVSELALILQGEDNE